jgi:hypothetical protein
MQASIADRSHYRLGDLPSAFFVGHKTVGTETQVPGKEELLAALDSALGWAE